MIRCPSKRVGVWPLVLLLVGCSTTAPKEAKPAAEPWRRCERRSHSRRSKPNRAASPASQKLSAGRESMTKLGPAQLDPVMQACVLEDHAEFTLLLQLAADGHVKQSLVAPSTPYSECIRAAHERLAFPGAPWEGYWLEEPWRSR